ncbi:hypothetical protein MNB_ARC-1_452 [hydrothermal vent metagenome]|uniref:Uncharacterized protein n=1 Tax=hydrothermal vent metagenome TaxID=652676 RepID=A0A3B1E560_9ZZZZ
MLKALCILTICFVDLFGYTISSDDNYQVYKEDKYSIIYTLDYQEEAKFIKQNIDDFIKQNDKSFGYSFNEPIKIVLVSNNIQVANGFSNQTPFNMGIYFIGGSGMNDYFGTTSWLATLFAHEMIHNYQMNAKKSTVSKTLHKYLGDNSNLISVGPIPLFTLPNLLLPTLFLEGNAVLNESLRHNGGRLYNGSLNALKNSLIFSNKIDTSRLINDHLEFPYRSEKYIVGGYFMKYLAKHHGINKVNKFYYEHSDHYVNPLSLNLTFKKYFGISFESSVENFVKYTKDKYKNFKELKPKTLLAKSKSSIDLSKIDNKIYFITSDLKSKKQLHSYDINSDNHVYNNTRFQNGKVFKYNDTFYVAASGVISPREQKWGLFDEDNYILDTTKGKKIDDIYDDKLAYININESFLYSKLYINDQFYAKVSSSTLFDKSGNIYYFKQLNDKRVLYKNKNEIFRFDGYFSKIIDIVDDEIYFIANTENGSSLYKFSNNKLNRLHASDNIINGKIIDKDNAIVVSVTANGYNVSKISLASQAVSNIEYEDVVNENENDQESYAFKFDNKLEDLHSVTYNEWSQLEFSYLYPSYQHDSKDGSIYKFDAHFQDIVDFNSLDIYRHKDKKENIAGFRYTHTKDISFKIDLHKIINKDADQGDYGGSLEIYDPLLKKGRHSVDVKLKKYYADTFKDKKPMIFNLNHTYKETMKFESSPYFATKLSGIFKEDREDKIYGADLSVNANIFRQLYSHFQILRLYSDVDKLEDYRGIGLTTNVLNSQQDITNVLIEDNNNDIFVKDITKLSIGLSTTIDLSYYFTNFPISIRNEVISYTHNLYNYNVVANTDETITENVLSLKLNLLAVHLFPIPLTIKYIKNDSTPDEYKTKVGIEVHF